MASIHSPEPIPLASWFYQLKSSSHYSELTLQRILLYKLQEILPAYSVTYYDKSIQSLDSPYNVCKPDFLIWKNDYSEWYVVEVELENHHITHIRKQIDTFYNGDYDNVKEITDYVSVKAKTVDLEIDKAKFSNLISSQRPKIMLMADGIRHEWLTEFSKYDCLFSSLQVYCDEHDGFLYRFSGDFPQVYTSYSYCVLDKFLRAINISFKDYLTDRGYTSGSTIKLYYRGVAYNWLLDVSEGIESLYFDGEYIPLDLTQTRWKLIMNDRGQLHIFKS